MKIDIKEVIQRPQATVRTDGVTRKKRKGRS